MEFMGIGFLEILIILLLVLMVFGPDKMIETARVLGKYARKFRLIAAEVNRRINEELESEALDVKDEVKEIGREVSGELKDVSGDLAKGIDLSLNDYQESGKKKQSEEQSETQDD